MTALRFSQATLVVFIFFYLLLVGYNNMVDYGSNFAFVQHVLLMDIIFPSNPLASRSITNSTLHHVVYWIIISGEIASGVLCFLGGLRLFRNIRSENSIFTKKKNLAIAGLTIGIVLWFFGFMTIAGEWFLMWQSQKWNGQQAAFRLIVCMGVVLIYLIQNEPGSVNSCGSEPKEPRS
ncbi:hypothetical protein CCL16_17255 [Pseudomonas syringae]|uniref:DUF2165 family protein n=1 Tax=Pseudomonas TaxID=286 RepID=UPI000BB615D5|nr:MULTISPECIES: DUF2165 domain-containing protein [Pseudomonas]PBP83429.1 hypothetical protein CCL16_17255 [Pseudomonas syringae]